MNRNKHLRQVVIETAEAMNRRTETIDMSLFYPTCPECGGANPKSLKWRNRTLLDCCGYELAVAGTEHVEDLRVDERPPALECHDV